MDFAHFYCYISGRGPALMYVAEEDVAVTASKHPETLIFGSIEKLELEMFV